MWHNLGQLPRYRGLIQSLVARELKARYRGSVLGFFWSFINPLLLLLIYTFVFTVVLPGTHPKEIEPYALFMFCGILPWTWFSSSLNESAGVLISGGNLIKKVLFPAEILPIVTVYAPDASGAFPLVVLVQLILTLGFALLLSALTVHFRDIRDILSNLLTFWFFATPIIYPWFLFEDPANPGHHVWQATLLKLNPFTHLAISYQEILFFEGPVGHLPYLLLLGAISVVWFLFGYFMFDRLRDTFAEEV